MTGVIPNSFFDLTALESLSFIETGLNTIPPELFQMDNVRSLGFRGDEITEIPPEIGQMVNLVRLSFSDMPITSLPPEIGELKNLEKLSVWNTKLASLPRELGQLDKVQTLDLDDNEITNWPEDMDRMASLWLVEIRNNKLQSLPAVLGRFRSLRKIEAQHNEITFIAPELGNLPYMHSLFVTHNKLQSVPAELANMPRLEALLLSNNQLTTLPASFKALPQLWVDNNQLTELPKHEPGTLNYARVGFNRLTFEDLEHISLPPDRFFYEPQARLGTKRTETIPTGGYLILKIPVGGENNVYQWYKDKQPLAGATTDSLVIENAGPGNVGQYILRVTNPLLPRLTLESEPIEVNVGQDDTPPICGEITFDPGKNGYSSVTTFAYDLESGISKVEFVKLKNINPFVKPEDTWIGPGITFTFDSQVTDTVGIQGRKARSWGHSIIVAEVTNGVGNKMECDPVLDRLGTEIPEVFALEQNYPNPFNPSTTVRFQIAEPAMVELTIFDMLGREVVTLVEKEMEPGTFEAVWDGRNHSGLQVAGGVYLYQLKAGTYVETHTMTLVK